ADGHVELPLAGDRGPRLLAADGRQAGQETGDEEETDAHDGRPHEVERSLPSREQAGIVTPGHGRQTKRICKSRRSRPGLCGHGAGGRRRQRVTTFRPPEALPWPSTGWVASMDPASSATGRTQRGLPLPALLLLACRSPLLAPAAPPPPPDG